jgi:hypothetical protein
VLEGGDRLARPAEDLGQSEPGQSVPRVQLDGALEPRRDRGRLRGDVPGRELGQTGRERDPHVRVDGGQFQVRHGLLVPTELVLCQAAYPVRSRGGRVGGERLVGRRDGLLELVEFQPALGEVRRHRVPWDAMSQGGLRAGHRLPGAAEGVQELELEVEQRGLVRVLHQAALHRVERLPVPARRLQRPAEPDGGSHRVGIGLCQLTQDVERFVGVAGFEQQDLGPQAAPLPVGRVDLEGSICSLERCVPLPGGERRPAGGAGGV